MAKNKKVVKESKDKRHFFKDFKAELKKVIWPTPKQLVNNTIAVITIVLIIGIIVLALDLCFDAINKYGINKIRTVVSEQVQQNNDSNQTTDEENNSSEDKNISENENSSGNENTSENETANDSNATN